MESIVAGTINTPDKEEVRKFVHELHVEGVRLSETYRRSEARMIEILVEIAKKSGYLFYTAPTLTDYAYALWSLPEETARNFALVARKAIEFPALIDALKANRATVSKLRKVCPVLTQKDCTHWLNLVHECSSRIVERTVAITKAEMSDDERHRLGLPDRRFDEGERQGKMRFQVWLTPEAMEKMERAAELLSSESGKFVGSAEAVEMMADQAIERLDPIRRAERTRKRAQAAKKNKTATNRDTNQDVTRRTSDAKVKNVDLTEQSVACANTLSTTPTSPLPTSQTLPSPPPTTPPPRTGRRKHIRSETLHTVNLRDRGQCTHVNVDGKRCVNRRWIQTHHRVHLSEGGGDEVDNLTTLCSSCHRAYHHPYWDNDDRELAMTTP